MTDLRQRWTLIAQRAFDPLGACVRDLARPRRVLPLLFVRVLAAVALAVHYGELLAARALLAPVLELGAPLWGLWLFALCGCVGLALGYASRACSLVLLTAAIASVRALHAIAYFDDYLAIWLAAWLCLMPLARAPRLFAWLRGGAGAEQASWGGARIALVANSALYANAALWEANLPGYRAAPACHALLALAPLLALGGRRSAALGLCVLLAGHVWLASLGVPLSSSLSLLALVPLYLAPQLKAAATSAPPTRAQGVTFASGLALLYATVLVIEAAAPIGSPARRASSRLLERIALTAPRDPHASGAPPPAFELRDARGEPHAQSALASRSLRGVLLYSYLTDQPWQRDRRSVELGERVRAATARAACAGQPAHARFELRKAGDAKAEPVLRFECAAGKPRLLPQGEYAGDLLLPSDPGFSAPELIPQAQHAADYVGSAQCGPCHAREHASWRATPHANDWMTVTAAEIRGAFARKPSRAPVQMLRDEHTYSMTLLRQAPLRVDGVIGTGRAFQAYLTRRSDSWYVLPWIWLSAAARWTPLSDLYPELYDPNRPSQVQLLSLDAAGCAQCHALAAHSRASSAGAQLELREPDVGCEGCHGPGRAHVAQRSSNGSNSTALRDPYAGVRAAQRCAQCHGPGLDRGRYYGPNGLQPGGLEHPRIAADGGAQRLEYQSPAFELSACHQRGGATCSSCHAVHDSNTGVAALDPRAPERCTGCHAALLAQQPPHTPHPAGPTCQDCHMPKRALRGHAQLGLLETSHDIAIPRPSEAALLETRSACTAACHVQRDEAWASAALRAFRVAGHDQVRPFVRELHAIKTQAFPARDAVPAPAVIDVLSHEAAPVRLALVRLLARVRSEPALVPQLRALASDPSPELRAAVAVALSVHDPAHAFATLEHAARDGDPVVRMPALRRLLDLQHMDEQAQRQYLRDMLDHSADTPTPELLRLATLRTRAGQPAEARAILELAARYAQPSPTSTAR